jgi:hypothetical protein
VDQLGDDRLNQLVETAGGNVGYLAFLAEFRSIMNSQARVYPMLYSHVLGPEHSAARFSDPDLLSKLDPMQRLLRYYQGAAPNELNQALMSLGQPGFIGIEALAMRFGMTEIAEEVRAARLQQVEKTRIWLGLSAPG